MAINRKSGATVTQIAANSGVPLPRDHRLGFWGTFYALALARHRRATEAHDEVLAACRRDPQFYVARIVLNKRSQRQVLAVRKRRLWRYAKHDACVHGSRLTRLSFW